MEPTITKLNTVEPTITKLNTSDYMDVKYLGTEQELIDSAYSRAVKESAKEKKIRNRLKDAKNKNAKKVATAANQLNKKLTEAVNDFPRIDEMAPFYKELMHSTIDVDEIKQALSQMISTAKIIVELKKKHIARMNRLTVDTNPAEVGEIARAFFGRASSVMRKCRKSLEIYDNARKKMHTIPKIKTHLPTVILAGFPNTGKSTILKRLTSSSPEIAHYPFTTKNLMMGYVTYNYNKIQIIDTPGLLDRPVDKRNIVEKRAISALNNLGELILFIIDPTERCGYALKEQRKLLDDMQKEFKIPFKVIINKTDIATEEEIKNAKAGLRNVILEGENVESGLLETMIGKLKLQAPERYARKSGASKK